MNIDLFRKRLEKLSINNMEFEFFIESTLTKEDILKVENKLGLTFPNNLAVFYKILNGLETKNPNFRIVSIENLTIDQGKIHFATFDNNIDVCLKTNKLNSANEWTIINWHTEFEITKTISSFWSNKIWHWLENRNTIWEDNWWIKKRP